MFFASFLKEIFLCFYYLYENFKCIHNKKTIYVLLFNHDILFDWYILLGESYLEPCLNNWRIFSLSATSFFNFEWKFLFIIYIHIWIILHTLWETTLRTVWFIFRLNVRNDFILNSVSIINNWFNELVPIKFWTH